mmetsp:Transcript_25791/g.79550  ORF Transcript_25791/g.79550 Transcript_25791/m.79550 type:complete len:243 (-) Transcript_25791:897-1625(-)
MTTAASWRVCRTLRYSCSSRAWSSARFSDRRQRCERTTACIFTTAIAMSRRCARTRKPRHTFWTDVAAWYRVRMRSARMPDSICSYISRARASRCRAASSCSMRSFSFFSRSCASCARRSASRLRFSCCSRRFCFAWMRSLCLLIESRAAPDGAVMIPRACGGGCRRCPGGRGVYCSEDATDAEALREPRATCTALPAIPPRALAAAGIAASMRARARCACCSAVLVSMAMPYRCPCARHCA